MEENRLSEDRLRIVLTFILALKAMALELSRPTVTLTGKSADHLSRLALLGVEKELGAMPRQELLEHLQELADKLGVEFVDGGRDETTD